MEIKECKEQNNRKPLSRDSESEVGYHPTYTWVTPWAQGVMDQEDLWPCWGGTPKLPLWWLINHEINLIDPNKQINYHLPKCPDALKEELAEKISWYTSAGWWVPVTLRKAMPMLCILKKNRKLCMVLIFNLHMQNENMEKDVSPFLDQDTIQHDIAHAAYRSKLDMSEVYKQICVCDKDVPKTAFTTIFSTFMSRVMQQRDCNAPSTFQRLMMLHPVTL